MKKTAIVFLVLVAISIIIAAIFAINPQYRQLTLGPVVVPVNYITGGIL